VKTATISFDRDTVRTLLPPPHRWNISGTRQWTTYRLYAGDELTYVGATGDPRTRLLAHLANGKVADRAVLEFHLSSSAMAKRERALLKELPGALNVRPGSRNGVWKARRLEVDTTP
jgi:hypothetical protein